MKLPYNPQSGVSGVLNYEVFDSAIVLEFRHGRFRYLYDHTAPGIHHVREMIRLARLGKGLSTYVSQHIHDRYAARLPLTSEAGSEPRP